MQIVSLGDNLHELSNPVFLGQENKKNIIYVSYAELAQRVVELNSEDIQWNYMHSGQ